MINIITGEINSGKTTALQTLYRHLQKGDGIALPKYYRDGEYCGQRILQLATGQAELFSLRQEHIPAGWTERYRLNNYYSFAEKGMFLAENICGKIIKEQINPVFMDEIGPLELQKQGFYAILGQMIYLKKDLYLVVRKSCLDDVLRLFAISSFYLLTVENRVIQSRIKV